MVIGTCGNCGGAVKTPDIWHGVHQPTPCCERCGAIPINPHGNTIQMQKPQSAGWFAAHRKGV